MRYLANKSECKARMAKTMASLCLTIAIMIVIFMFSNQDGGDSGSLSDRVARLVAGIFVSGFADMNTSEQAGIIDMLSWPIRKTAHASEYACLAMSLAMTCWQIHCLVDESRNHTRALKRRLLGMGTTAFCIAVLYACSDEIHQLFVSERSGQFTDVLVDASGALIGALIACAVAYAFCKRRNAKRAFNSQQ